MTKITLLKSFFACLLLLLFMPSVQADTLANILKDGQLRVGVSIYEPWVMNDKDGKLSGYEIQVAEQLAKDLGVKADFHVVEWEELISSLNDNKIDIIISGMAITPQRALLVNFSHPYGQSGVSLAANIEKTKDIKSLEELNAPAVTLGVVADTVSDPIASNIFDEANIKKFVKSDDAIKALLNGDIHALIESSPVPKFLSLEHPNVVDAPLSKPLLSYKAAMAVNKGEQEFLNYLNAWITARDAEGWLPAKHKYWFDSLDWKSD
ncbi:MAG: transporter substrate-binding domain-containing protein [Pseudomonadota bacterium]